MSTIVIQMNKTQKDSCRGKKKSCLLNPKAKWKVQISHAAENYVFYFQSYKALKSKIGFDVSVVKYVNCIKFISNASKSRFCLIAKNVFESLYICM